MGVFGEVELRLRCEGLGYGMMGCVCSGRTSVGEVYGWMWEV